MDRGFQESTSNMPSLVSLRVEVYIKVSAENQWTLLDVINSHAAYPTKSVLMPDSMILSFHREGSLICVHALNSGCYLYNIASNPVVYNCVLLYDVTK